MRGFAFGIVAAIVAMLAGGYILVTSGAIPAGQDAKPGRLERWIARTSLKAALRRESKGLASPLASTDDNLPAGISLYVAHCQICHGGPDGTASPLARGLTPAAPQLARDGVEDDPEGTIYWKIKHGIRLTGMPSFGRSLSDREIWHISLFLKHMNALPPAAQQAWTAAR